MSAAALKAVSLDDGLAESHYVLAALRTWHHWNLPAAEPEWKRAIELNPNDPDALAMYSHFLMIMGRPDEAMVQIKRALGLDPFSVIIKSFYAIDLCCARRYSGSVPEEEQTIYHAGSS